MTNGWVPEFGKRQRPTLRQRSSGSYASDLILLKERSSICASADRARIVVWPSSPPSLWRSTGSSTCAWNSSKTLRMTVSPSHRRRRLIVVRLLPASRYFVQQASEELWIAALIHDDEELQREAVMSGDGIQG